ncbi:hypothetical protein AA313_de0209142 [Arthrobotrys entomopaga]|nr:hypothetical protein AA313_de0209142 [Arthrobotrys entomopaga]
MSTRLTHDDYTIAWICALPKERTAAIMNLDRIHARLLKPPNDNNTYTLGSIGEHNIVVACLPKGMTGTVSATSVIVHLINAFRSVKFGLLVGIGGGIPPKVRLGDVVVSTPDGQHPGVVQWDMGKAIVGGDGFEQTGTLNKPPKSILTALSALESEHDLDGSKVPEFLEELKTKYPKTTHPKVASKYLEPELEDLLFRSDYNHIEGSGPEDKACSLCDKTKIVNRKARAMKIHYGLIASGNQVIKDAAFRDTINKRYNGKVLCLKMEAAGILNEIPCIVIQGICNYADSHKNKSWQGYAAVVAAAFAKELLGYLLPIDVERERSARELIKD